MKSSGDKPKTSSVPHEWQGDPLVTAEKIFSWAKEQIPLVDCFLVAMSVHVILLPIMWIAGWALPWPKPPVITTIIEYDLRNWPKVAKPKDVVQIVDPDLNP
ncbi:hypothetical protein KF707_01850 [Candidatus Obscuribacterales bacterium]|nr:hypothetical protein [Candidatus Obscuribacterales bacterium]MBX3134949.1 hypothetical protein [Candidatus Obscuribacterales bacterium]